MASNRHHRKPRSRGGTNHSRNISIVPENQHHAWHVLFQNYAPEHVADIINEKWLDPDYVCIIRRKRR